MTFNFVADIPAKYNPMTGYVGYEGRKVIGVPEIDAEIFRLPLMIDGSSCLCGLAVEADPDSRNHCRIGLVYSRESMKNIRDVGFLSRKEAVDIVVR